MTKALLGTALLSAGLALAPGRPAKVLDIALGKNVFGLPVTATEADFRKLLGEPTTVVPMTEGRHALLYGNSVLLVFAHDRL
jgi:hypothetical protein